MLSAEAKHLPPAALHTPSGPLSSLILQPRVWMRRCGMVGFVRPRAHHLECGCFPTHVKSSPAPKSTNLNWEPSCWTPTGDTPISMPPPSPAPGLSANNLSRQVTTKYRDSVTGVLGVAVRDTAPWVVQTAMLTSPARPRV